MSFAITAVATSAVVGVGSAVASSKAARKANRTSKNAQADQMAFEQEKYDAWNEVYGPIQDNLSSYYQNVSPDYYATMGLEAFEKEYQTSLQRLDESFAQRGIATDSGIAASIEAQGELNAAEQRAGIRRDSERMAAEDKQNFLQVGLGQNPGNSMSSALSNAASNASADARAADQATGQAFQALGSTLVKGAEAMPKAIDSYKEW